MFVCVVVQTRQQSPQYSQHHNTAIKEYAKKETPKTPPHPVHTHTLHTHTLHPTPPTHTHTHLKGNVGHLLPQQLQPPPGTLVQKSKCHIKRSPPPHFNAPQGGHEVGSRGGGCKEVDGAYAGGEEGLVCVTPGGVWGVERGWGMGVCRRLGVGWVGCWGTCVCVCTCIGIQLLL